jgi:2OG-Fe(II) oxygenase superfamily
MDETYRKAKKMDNGRFTAFIVPDHTDLIKIVRTYLLEGKASMRKIKIEPYKLNVYSMRLIYILHSHLSRKSGEGSFFKAHVDTPRGEKMFGSLVIVLPSPHEGGTLVFRHHGQEWTFDSSTTLLAALPTSIAYAAFFCDVEHEILPVTSGHRVTLTYNLYYDDDERDPAKYLVYQLPSVPQDDNERGMFCSIFNALLNSLEFLPDGGFLGFGMRHVYQVKDTLEHVYSLLKGNDATVYQSLVALGFKPTLYLNYKYKDKDVLAAGVPDLEGEKMDEFVLRFGGVGLINDPVTWVTPKTRRNVVESAYVINYGNEAGMGYAYGHLCLIVRIGGPGSRLKY